MFLQVSEVIILMLSATMIGPDAFLQINFIPEIAEPVKNHVPHLETYLTPSLEVKIELSF